MPAASGSTLLAGTAEGGAFSIAAFGAVLLSASALTASGLGPSALQLVRTPPTSKLPDTRQLRRTERKDTDAARGAINVDRVCIEDLLVAVSFGDISNA